jgi:hypothetical protein
MLFGLCTCVECTRFPAFPGPGILATGVDPVLAVFQTPYHRYDIFIT